MSGEQDFSRRRVAGRVSCTASRVNSNGIQKQHGDSSGAQQPNRLTSAAQKRKLDSDLGINMIFIYI